MRFGYWYPLCHSHRADAVRTYRVDRVRSVELCPESFATPDDLDPATLLEQHLGIGWEFETRVVFDAPAAEVSRYAASPMGRLEPLDDGRRCVLVGATSDPAINAGEWLAAMPIPFWVEGGIELREAVAAVAARLTDALGPSVG